VGVAPDPVAWGLLSTANINDAFLGGAAGSDRARVVAVASRAAARAEAYASEHGIPRAHGSYEELLADPEVDAVYVSLPNGMHVEWTLRALEAGKHVLCEKPLTPRAEEAERCFDAAERAGLVLSEAFMWRHHPQTRRLADLVASGAIGEIRLVRASFSFLLDRAGDVRLDPALEGGALMDLGCYCVSGIRLLAGEPERVVGEAVAGTTGVDLRFAGILRLPDDVLATFDCGFDLPGRHDLAVVGSRGTLTVGDPWHGRQPGIELRRDNGVEWIDIDPADPYRLEVDDVSDAIRSGRPPLLGRADAVGQAAAIEALLRSAAEGRVVERTTGTAA
jgi:D-xylose 1-dehydrogenase (NADP+, D-xylono-1,5-lactone-forming)